MKAMVGYGDETVEQVQARHKTKHKEPAARGTTNKAEPVTASTAEPKKSELDKLAALMANAKPRPAPPVS